MIRTARTTLFFAAAALAAAGIACTKAPATLPSQARMQASARIEPISDGAAGLDPAHFWAKESVLENSRP